jgi:hypothetical protein
MNRKKMILFFIILGLSIFFIIYYSFKSHLILNIYESLQTNRNKTTLQQLVETDDEYFDVLAFSRNWKNRLIFSRDFSELFTLIF